MRLEVGGGAVEDVEAVALELDTLGSVCIYAGEPGGVEDLDECADGVRGEEGRVEDSGERAKVECACPGRLGGG